MQATGGVAATIGAVLLFLPDLIAGPLRPVVAPLDRITFPAMTAAPLSGCSSNSIRLRWHMNIEPAKRFSPGSARYAPSIRIPEAMQHAQHI
ncbi:hypothetical protein AB0L63_16305 [Nocardia sp. NPDC051990]|uniref:hypothetical protein n=1 Tax=Nocardia sp. NPDC051990 TaxID=3155285 RepID=UPI0034273B4C